ncbi:MAG TPA: tetratricopeptide repeat protein [Pyrinomonadaceae bacterium]|nr:tetratricopeptide repeat protein [Pyrinomonadaceae bacterium]
MSLLRASNRVFISLCLSACLAATALSQQPQNAQETQAGGALGKIDFPTSGSRAAQEHFLRGVAALHSFWYEEALEAFQAATKLEPDFALGYWGEAMAHNHPLWNEQDADAARRALANIRESAKLTPREAAYVNAVKILYGAGDRHERNLAYAAAMEKVYKDYPEDLEAATFYALSLLGAVRPTDKGYRLQARAGAVALDVFAKNPRHPGAAHYVIHAFDDPEHAILALPAARRYAEIAADAHHARHMPSHIFIQLGMWPEAAASNESSWATSDAWVKRKKHSIERRDYHSLSWLEYVYLQQGRVREAEAQLALMQRSIAELGAPIRGSAYIYGVFIAETERWELIDKLFPAPHAKSASLHAQKEVGADACHVAASKPASASVLPATLSAQTSPRPTAGHVYGAYVRGLAAAASVKNVAEADRHVADMRALGQEFAKAGNYAFSPDMIEVMALEVAALARANAGKFAEAVELLRRATRLEESLRPPSGPPDMLKPSHELFGEVLLAAGRPAEAAAQFQTALLRQPNRPRSLLGLARAAKTTDAKLAARAYSDYLRTQERADTQAAALAEARDYLKQSGGR